MQEHGAGAPPLASTRSPADFLRSFLVFSPSNHRVCLETFILPPSSCSTHINTKHIKITTNLRPNHQFKSKQRFLSGYKIHFSLARHSSTLTRRHWYGLKHILRYLRGTINKGLFYSNKSKVVLTSYADAGYLSDPDKARSHSRYLFTHGETSVSCRSVKQSLAATSSNHVEILAIHEASRKCVWLRSICQHIRESCDMHHERTIPTMMFEDNTAYIEQLKNGYIKGDNNKHISPKFFFTNDLQ